MDYVSWSTRILHQAHFKRVGLTEVYFRAEVKKERGAWPFIHTSCFPLMRLRYQSIEKRRERAAGADSKSASFSNKGTTRKGLAMRHSRCKSSTASTSDGAVAMEMTYAPKQSDGSSAITLMVSSTSFTSADIGKSEPKSGRFPRSSDRRNSCNKDQHHSILIYYHTTEAQIMMFLHPFDTGKVLRTLFLMIPSGSIYIAKNFISKYKIMQVCLLY